MMMKGRATVQKEIGPLSDPAEKNYLELLCELEINLYFIWAIYIVLVSFCDHSLALSSKVVTSYGNVIYSGKSTILINSL